MKSKIKLVKVEVLIKNRISNPCTLEAICNIFFCGEDPILSYLHNHTQQLLSVGCDRTSDKWIVTDTHKNIETPTHFFAQWVAPFSAEHREYMFHRFNRGSQSIDLSLVFAYLLLTCTPTLPDGSKVLKVAMQSVCVHSPGPNTAVISDGKRFKFWQSFDGSEVTEEHIQTRGIPHSFLLINDQWYLDVTCVQFDTTFGQLITPSLCWLSRDPPPLQYTPESVEVLNIDLIRRSLKEIVAPKLGHFAYY
jgi:hypothetical protein